MSNDALDAALAEISAGKARPFYLVHGEEFLARRAVEALCDALVPPKNRDLNFAQLDGAAGGREVAMNLDTVPMFRGTKAVFVDGADVLLAKRDLAKEFARAKELWNQPARRKDAARRLLSIVAPAGWTHRELDPDAPGAPSKTRWKKEVGFEPEADDKGFLSEVAAFAGEIDLKAPKDDLDALLRSLTNGPPKGNHLVLLCEEFDAKHPVAKLVTDRGLVIQRAPEVAPKVRGIQGLDIGELCREVLEPHGKRITPAGMSLLKDRIGAAMRQLASELEKLALYTGDRKVIDERDVELLVAPLREEDYFELANALGDGNAARALKLLEDDLARGKFPLMIFGGLAGAIRRLALDAARLSRIPGALAGRELASRDFEATVYPALCQLISDRAPHPFVAWNNYKRIRRHGTVKLLRALALCADVDQRLKRGANAQLELERIILALCSSGPAEPRQ